MKTLVIGGAGYLGIPLCTALSSMMNVTCYDSLMHDNITDLASVWGEPGFQFVHGDIRDRELLQKHVSKVDIVYNLAALVGAPICDRRPKDAVEINQDAVKSLAQMLSPHQTLVQFTSNSGYGMTDGSSEVDETSPLNPVSLYGKTKVEAEKYVMERERSYSLRLATVFGVAPRMRFDLLVNNWTVLLQERKACRDYYGEVHPLVIYEPHYLRNYVHVRDVARVAGYIVWCCERSSYGIYNVGNPSCNCSKMQLAEAICKELQIDPSQFIKIGTDKKDPDQRNYKVNNQKLLDTGFRFKKDLQDGIREVASYAENLTEGQIKDGGNA